MADEVASPRRERFLRLASARTNAVMDKLDILGNCSNKQAYDYTGEDIERVFSALLKKVRETKARFDGRKKDRFKL